MDYIDLFLAYTPTLNLDFSYPRINGSVSQNIERKQTNQQPNVVNNRTFLTIYSLIKNVLKTNSLFILSTIFLDPDHWMITIS